MKGYSDENDWDIVNGLSDESLDSIVMVDFDENDDISNKFTYKEVLSRPIPSKKSLDVVPIQNLGSKTKWHPKFLATSISTLRADREYGTKSSPILTDDESLDMIDAQPFLKLQTSIAKRRAISMLPLKVQAKKTQRILEKKSQGNN